MVGRKGGGGREFGVACISYVFSVVCFPFLFDSGPVCIGDCFEADIG